MKGFGFDKTEDVFSKLEYKIGKSLRFNVSHWTVYNHRKQTKHKSTIKSLKHNKICVFKTNNT